MNERRPDNLDEVLRRWAANRAAGNNDLADLEKRITASLGNETFRVLDEMAVQQNRAIRWRNAMAAVSLAAALSLLVVVGIWTFNRPAASPTHVTPEFAWLTNQQLEHKKTLLAECDRLFDQRLTWIAETGKRVEFGLAEEGVPLAPDSRPLAVRIVVVRRDAERNSRQPVWAVDVISRNEQVVHLTPKSTANAELTFWAYVLPDGRIAVDTKLRLDAHKLKSTVANQVQQNGIPQKLYSAQIDGVEYEVYQTVSLLDERVG